MRREGKGKRGIICDEKLGGIWCEFKRGRSVGVRGDGFRIGEEEKGSLENEKEKKERAERRNS